MRSSALRMISRGLRLMTSTIGWRATVSSSTSRANSGDSITLRRTQRPTPTSSRLSRNGTRQPQLSNASPEMWLNSETAPVDSSSSFGAPASLGRALQPFAYPDLSGWYARPGPHADPHPGGTDSRSTNAGHAPERRLRRARGHPYHSVGPARPTAHHPAGGPRVTQERRAARPRRAVLLGTVEHPRTRPVWCPLAARGRHGPEPGFGLAFHTIGMTRPGASPTTLGL